MQRGKYLLVVHPSVEKRSLHCSVSEQVGNHSLQRANYLLVVLPSSVRKTFVALFSVRPSRKPFIAESELFIGSTTFIGPKSVRCIFQCENMSEIIHCSEGSIIF